MFKSISNHFLLRSLQVFTASTLAVTWLCAPYQAIHADSPAVSYSNTAGERIQAPLQKPLWSVSVDPLSHSIITEEGLIIAFAGKALVALDAKNGKKVYQYGSKLQPTAISGKGMVFGVTEDGHLFALDAKSGKLKWQSTEVLITNGAPVLIGETLYTTKGNVTIAIQSTTGKVLWKTEEPSADYAGTVQMVEGGIVYVTFLVQGALSSVQLDAFDQKTGKKLWGDFRQSAPLQVKDGLVYSESIPTPFQDDTTDRELNIAVLNAKTGKVESTQTYSWTLSGVPPYASFGGSVLLNGNDLYITTENAVQKFDITKYQKNGKPLQKWSKPSLNATFIGTVHSDRLFFTDYATSRLIGMKIANGQTIGWGTDNPPVQTDIYGNGVYIGQSDGVFHGYNLLTQSPAFTININSRSFGPTLKRDNTLIIQATETGKLIAVQVPKALQ